MYKELDSFKGFFMENKGSKRKNDKVFIPTTQQRV
jgi:hypothetical protein